MLYIFNQNEVLIDILSNEDLDQPIITNDIFKRQVNQEWSYSFDINITKLVEQNIKVKNKVGFYDENGNFQLFTIEKVEDNFGDKDIKSVLCYHDFYSLVNKIIENLELTNVPINTAITSVLQGTNYQLGNYIPLGNKDVSITYMSSLEALNDMIIKYGAEVSYRLTLNANKTGIGNRYVDIGRMGQDTGIRFSFDLNVTEIKRTVDTVNLFNVLYGRGKSSDTEDEMGNRKITFADVTWTTPTNPTNKPLGQTYIEDAESISTWGRLEGVFSADDIEDKSFLLQRTWEKLQEMKNPQITYEVSIVDLARITGFEHLKVTLGDTIFIYDTDYDINLEARIIEESYSIFDPTTKEIVLGNFLKGYTDNNTTGNLSNRLDILEDDIKSGNVVAGYPDTLPTVPIVIANGLFSSVQLSWSYENKPHYEYEVFASKILNFTPDSSNLIYRGKASTYLHEVLPKETWYYRVRAINTSGSVTAYSDQVTATTLKISDATQYFEDLAIKHALIESLNLDKATVGKLKGQYIDAKNLTVTDGNENTTFEVDSFGNVNIKANNFKMIVNNIEEDVATVSEMTQTAEEVLFNFNKTYSSENILYNSQFEVLDGIWDSTHNKLLYWGFSNNNPEVQSTAYVWDSTSEWVLDGKKVMSYNINPLDTVCRQGQWQIVTAYENTQYSISCLYAGHRATGGIEIHHLDTNNAILNVDFHALDPLGNGYSGGKNLSGWGKAEKTITTVAGTKKLLVWYRTERSVGSDGYIWITDCKVEQNKVVTSWTPNPTEVSINNTSITQEGVRVVHNDGSYSLMSGQGFKNYNSGTERFYHYLSTLGEVFVNSEQTVEISLPEEYRNKNITVIASASQIGTGTDSISNPKPVISFYVDVVNVYNNPSGRQPYFTLYCSTRLRNNDGSVAYQDKGVLASWTAIS